MKTRTIFSLLIIDFTLSAATGQRTNFRLENPEDFDYITALKDTLNCLADDTDNEYFRLHCQSMIAVIESKDTYTAGDSAFLEDTYNAFNNGSDTCNPKDFTTYLDRRRSMILSWVSSTDGNVSFSWLKLPKNWDPEQEYPLFIQLHGLWDVAGDLIHYLTYPYLNNPSTSISFEEGYLLSPWGRVNLWYQGISETDIRECITALETIVSVNPKRKYLSGHSMGGYGTWHIALNSPEVWAAIGIHAGALWYGGQGELNAEAAAKLRDVPVYFVCGTQDGLLSVNQQAFQLLQNAGNQNLAFVTFNGGHEYVEENVLNMYLWMKEFVNADLNSIDILPAPRYTTGIRNYPNPFSSFTLIEFTLAGSGYATLEIFNPVGLRIETLITGEFSSGKHQLSWIPKSLPEGIYYLVLRTESGVETSKLVFNK